MKQWAMEQEMYNFSVVEDTNTHKCTHNITRANTYTCNHTHVPFKISLNKIWRTFQYRGNQDRAKPVSSCQLSGIFCFITAVNNKLKKTWTLSFLFVKSKTWWGVCAWLNVSTHIEVNCSDLSGLRRQLSMSLKSFLFLVMLLINVKFYYSPLRWVKLKL